MQLVIVGSSGARTCSWESYASLRAQLLHQVEADQNSGRFFALDTVAKVARGNPQAVDAVRLRLEVLQAGVALRDRHTGSASRGSSQGAQCEFSQIVLSLTARAVAGERLMIRADPASTNAPTDRAK